MRYFYFLIFISFLTACPMTPVSPPVAVQPAPNAQQFAWQQMEFYAFIHFNMNTFSNMEWGMGDESPRQFNPTALDCRQWAKVAKEAGMTAIILTAKHHDGFCLWPSAYTEHSVKNSPWKEGKGDVIRELADACKEYGLKMGIYLSPWDRNHADYGKPEYIDYFRNQLTELLTNYGEVFEVWFDGANGGTGYYGGANEERRVDKKKYYDWPGTIKLIRELQPNAIIWSDAGPDARWVGNEHGYAYPTTWSPLMRDSVYGGQPEYAKKWSMGQENGTHWVPAEADVSIRPGWYYHPYEDHKVKSLDKLLDIYYRSVGRNSTLLLNFPVDKRGLIHENDVAQLQKLTDKLKEDFAKPLSVYDVIASNERGKGFQANRVLNPDIEEYWATEEGIIQSELVVEFDKEEVFNRIVLQEYIPLGQRVKAFKVEIQNGEGDWETIAEETTIGYKRILRLPDLSSKKVKLSILDAKGPPTISHLSFYHAPKLLMPPSIQRDQQGMVSMEVPESDLDIRFTLDGTEPDTTSQLYESPLKVPGKGTVKAVAVDGGQLSETNTITFDIAPENWKIINKAEGKEKVLDGDPESWWAVGKSENALTIDLGASTSITGFNYLPMQARWISGFIKAYEFYGSANGRDWKLLSRGEFGNILNSPILQEVYIKPAKARFVRLKAVSTVDGNPASFAEFGVKTE